jgi:hypothetical protein
VTLIVLHVQYNERTVSYVWRELFWNDDNEAHIARHDVTLAEVEEVVNTRPRYETKGGDNEVLVMGQTDAGRHLLIVLVESRALPGAWYVVTARDLTNNEARTFREKGR